MNWHDEEGRMSRSRLPVEGPVTLVYPTVAVKVGLLEAIFLQQVHYNVQFSRTTIEGCKWFQCTNEGWLLQIPFLSKSTIERLIKSLHKRKLIEKKRFDHTGTYYRVRYDELQKLLDVDIPPI